MESINLDLDDLMEPVDELEDDYDLPVVSALPAFDDDNDENLLDTSVQHNDGLLDTLLDPGGGEAGDAPAKKTVNRKPIPKLDATRLTGERGLPALLKHFEKVKYKGKGHEVSDLDLLMRTLEHWAHRLFPKMPFDDVIERIEKLGSKKPVQTCLKRIRLDMPLMDEDFVTRGEDDVAAANDVEIVGADVDDIFPTQPLSATQTPSALNRNTPKVAMTDEQRERIERNKRLAMERKLAKQQDSQEKTQSQTTGLKDSDLDDHIIMETSGKSSYAGNQDGIDSEEEEIEREMWNQMMGGSKENKKKEEQDGEKKKEEKKDGQVSGKVREDVCEIDSDDEEMENEIWNQMTEPIPSQLKKASQEAEFSQVPSRKKRRVILDDDDDDDDDDDEDDDVVVCEKMEANNDISNEMTEPVLSQTQKESTQKEMQVDPELTSSGKERVSAKDVDSDDAEMGHEICNQMTEPIPTQSTDASQRKVQNSKSAVLTTTVHDSNEDDNDDDVVKKQSDPKMGVDICNEMTEPVDTDIPATSTGSSQMNGLGQDVMQSRETFVEQDDADLDDSSLWTQITSTNPGDVPSTNPEDDLSATATSHMSGDSHLGQDVMQSMETFVEQDDADLDDSSMWTQITSTNPGDDVPSTNPEDNLPGTDKDHFDDDMEAEESQSIFVATAGSKKRKMIISDDEDDE